MVARIRVVRIVEVVAVYDPVGDAVAVIVGAEERVVEIDAGVDDHRGKTAAVDTGEARVGPEIVDIDQGPRLRRLRLNVTKDRAVTPVLNVDEVGAGAGNRQHQRRSAKSVFTYQVRLHGLGKPGGHGTL